MQGPAAAEIMRRQLLDYQRVQDNMKNVKYKIAIMSGKGGVGKSVVTANLAVSTAKLGFKTGILDADITGPSIPRILGMTGSRLQEGTELTPPANPYGIEVVSMDFLVDKAPQPIIWRGPLKANAIRQFLSEVGWGPLDYLFIDLPPGTSDEPLTITQLLPTLTGIVIVTIPSEVSQAVVKKSVAFAQRMKARVFGIIENMSGFVCPHCGHETQIFRSGGGQKIAKEMGISFLGSIPLDPRICEASDEGKPFIMTHEDTPAAKSFLKIADKIKRLAESSKDQQTP